MVLKKDILVDLKKFNKDLDSHLQGLDLDSLKNSDSNTTKEDEYFSILASNMMDLRTEVAIMRKNISTDIEGMVTRLISKQQEAFLSQINQFYGRVIIDLKQNFGEYIKEMSMELNEVKKQFNVVSNQNEVFNSRLQEFAIDLSEFKSLMANLDSFIKNDKSSLILSKFDLINDNLNSFEKNYHMDFVKNNKLFEDKLIQIENSISKFQTENDDKFSLIDNNFSNRVSKMENKFISFDKELMKSIKSNSNMSEDILKVSSNNQMFEKIENDLNEKVSSLSQKLENIEKISKKIDNNNFKNKKIIQSDDLDNIKNDVLSNSNIYEDNISTIQVIKNKKDDSSNIKKLLDIDMRIEKLNKLR